MDGTSAAESPNPGSAAEPQTPLNVGFPKTIFWDAATFGQISKDVHSIFSGALFIYQDPIIETGEEIRSDHQEIRRLLDAKTVKSSR